MSSPNTQKIANVQLRILRRCQEVAGKHNGKYFVLALQSAETFCGALDPSKGSDHYGLTSQEASVLTESQFEELYKLLLSYYALAVSVLHIKGVSEDIVSDTAKVVGSGFIQRIRDDSSSDPSSLLPGYSLTDYRAVPLVARIIGGRQHDTRSLLQTLHYTAYKMLEVSLEKIGRGGCFVATAVYGSELHPNVVLLQRFRDTRLVTSVSGRVFVRLYYRLGPTMAGIVSARPILQKTIKCLLDTIVSAFRPNA